MDTIAEAPPPETIADTGPEANAAGAPEPSADHLDFTSALEEAKAEIDAAAKEEPAKEEAKEPEKEPEPEEEAKEEKPAKEKVKEPEPKVEEKDPEADGEQEAEPKAGQTERRRIDAPDTFNEDEGRVWRNTPHQVKEAVERTVTQLRQETEAYKGAAQKYAEVHDYAQLFESNGRSMRDAVGEYVKLENLVRSHPLAGINAVLEMAGPRKADGQPMNIMEIAQAVSQMGPDGYQKVMSQGNQQLQAQQQQQQITQQQAQLQQENAQLRAQVVSSSIIEPFKAANPLLNDPAVSDMVAKIVRSDMIDHTQPLQDRLDQAYRIAVQVVKPSAASSQDPEPSRSPAPDRVESFGDPSPQLSPSIGSVPRGSTSANNSFMDDLRETAKELRVRRS